MLSAVESETKQLLSLDESARSLDVGDAKLTGNIWRFHPTLMKEKYPEEQETNQNVIGIDFRNYLSQPVEDLKKCDPIKYWCNHKDTMYKKISKVAYKYMCIVGTSVPSERLFSVAGNIVMPNRNRLSGERLHRLIFLKSFC